MRKHKIIKTQKLPKLINNKKNTISMRQIFTPIMLAKIKVQAVILKYRNPYALMNKLDITNLMTWEFFP